MTNRVSIIYPVCLLAISLIFMSCREKTEQLKPTPVPEVAAQKSLAPEYMEIAAFMDISMTDSTDVDEVLSFKALFNTDSLADSDAAENLKFHKRILRTGGSTALPIFESRASDLSLVLLTGRGYVGPIWTEVLFDRQTRKIIKIRFDHKMETEGYGNAIIEGAFQDQFVGGEIRFDGKSFALKPGQGSVESVTLVDGISGATVTSSAVVQMLNTGFKGLEPYFTP